MLCTVCPLLSMSLGVPLPFFPSFICLHFAQLWPDATVQAPVWKQPLANIGTCWAIGEIFSDIYAGICSVCHVKIIFYNVFSVYICQDNPTLLFRKYKFLSYLNFLYPFLNAVMVPYLLWSLIRFEKTKNTKILKGVTAARKIR